MFAGTMRRTGFWYGLPNLFGDQHGDGPVEGLGVADRDYLDPSCELPYNRSGV